MTGGHFVQQIVTLCKIVRGHDAEHFCEIILNFGQWFWKRSR